jgi:aspartate-semialdehyde dehydrogenase
MSKELGDLVVKSCTAEEFKDEVDVVFSGLDSDVAQDTGELDLFVRNMSFSWGVPFENTRGHLKDTMLTIHRDVLPQGQHPRLQQRQELPP